MEDIIIRPRVMSALIAVLGAWLMLCIAMFVVASGNFGQLTPDGLHDSAKVFAKLEAGEPRRLALRYVAAELNRTYFSQYAMAQTALALLAIGLYFASGRGGKLAPIGLGLALVIALLVLFYFTPTIARMGREIAFMPRDPKPPEVSRFGMLHGISMLVDLIKTILVAGVLGLLLYDKG